CVCCVVSSAPAPHPLHSFPTRRSSDLFHRSEGVELFQVVRLRLGGGDEVLQGGFSEGFIPFGGPTGQRPGALEGWPDAAHEWHRSEEHTSELQSRFDLVCRLLLEKKN